MYVACIIACRLLPRCCATPEDTVVETEHIKGGHSCDDGHHPTHCRAILEASCQNFIFGEETRERRNTCNGETSYQEGDMRDRHVFA